MCSHLEVRLVSQDKLVNLQVHQLVLWSAGREWYEVQLFRAPRGRVQPLSPRDRQDEQAPDRKWLVGLPCKQWGRKVVEGQDLAAAVVHNSQPRLTPPDETLVGDLTTLCLDAVGP